MELGDSRAASEIHVWIDSVPWTVACQQSAVAVRSITEVEVDFRRFGDFDSVVLDFSILMSVLCVELGVENETIRTMEPRYKDLRLKASELLGSGLGRKHPNVIAVSNQITEARSMLENAVLAYRNSLPTKKQIAEDRNRFL